jgi:23S rRNA pseudouridine1911/1915/1917 synthase
MMLEILFEDEWLLAVDKPAGLVVHPTYKNEAGTLLDEIRVREPGAALSIVGRLDKLTSGIVLMAKNAATHAAMQAGWPEAEKDYLAVVSGCPDARGRIALPIGTDPADRRRRIVTPLGAGSVTDFERVQYAESSGRALLRCRLLTGRRHQIRVHLAARGWPIVGDAVYGEPLEGFPRHALHAWRLALAHPATGAAVSLEAPVPVDVARLLQTSGLPLTSQPQL